MIYCVFIEEVGDNMEIVNFYSQKEKKLHSTALTPYTYFYCVLPCSSHPNVPLHWHSEMEIDYVLSGTALYQVCDKSFEAKQGDIIVVGPNILHSVHPGEDCTLISDTLIFHLDFLGASSADKTAVSYLRPLMNSNSTIVSPFITQDNPAYKDYSECLNKLFMWVKEQSEYFELGMKCELLRFIQLIYANGLVAQQGITTKRTVYVDKIKLALQYIQDNYKDEIMVSDLARLCHFSKAYFMNFFKQSVGMSCIEYLNQFRLRAASEMLRTTDTQISEVAFECGFRNLSNFNRQFRKCFNLTPRVFREVGEA